MDREEALMRISEMMELPEGIMYEIFKQFEAVERFSIYNRNDRVYYEWLKGATFEELAKKYHVDSPDVIMYAIMLRHRMPVFGTIKMLPESLYTKYKKAYEQWKLVTE